MYTTKLTDSIECTHNGDFSGLITFYYKGKRIANIPSQAIRTLVGEMIRSERIRELENMSTEEVLCYQLLSNLFLRRRVGISA